MSTQYASVVRNALSRAQAEASYLRLDCANDPLTAQLDGVAFNTCDDTELMTNGDFATASDWTFGGDWSWNALGYANLSTAIGDNGNLSPATPLAITVGSRYKLTFTATIANSTIDASCGGVSFPQVSSTGTYVFVFEATATTNLNFYGLIGSGTGKRFCRIDDVSLTSHGELCGYMRMVGAELTGALKLTTAGASDIGEDGVGVRRIWLDDGLSVGSNLNASGLVARFAAGDMAVGNDNIFPSYYVQKTVVHNSTVRDNSEDYTNLYQGNSSYQMIAMMYDIEYSASPANGIIIGDGTVITDPVPLMFGPFANRMEFRNDRTNTKFITKGYGSLPYWEIGLTGTDPAVRPDTDGLIDIGDLTNSLRWRNGYFSGSVRADTRFDVGTSQGHTGWIDDGVNFRATFTGGILTGVAASTAGGFA